MLTLNIKFSINKNINILLLEKTYWFPPAGCCWLYESKRKFMTKLLYLSIYVCYWKRYLKNICEQKAKKKPFLLAKVCIVHYCLIFCEKKEQKERINNICSTNIDRPSSTKKLFFDLLQVPSNNTSLLNYFEKKMHSF